MTRRSRADWSGSAHPSGRNTPTTTVSRRASPRKPKKPKSLRAASAVAELTTNNARKYPDFAWGATPPTLGGMKLDSNSTVEFNASKDRAIVGDFSAFRWGFAKEMPMEIIEYGDPDGSGTDLKKANQVLIRSEAYIGWAILDGACFARVYANP